MEISVSDLLKQLAIVIPTILVGTQTVTAALHGVFNIEKTWVNHLISWLVALAAGICCVACKGLTFGFGGWDYALGAVAGLAAGAMANGCYDWDAIKKIFDALTELCRKKEA